MAVSVTLNGTNYSIPQVGDSAWGTSLTNYLVAISTSVLQKTGGSFTLTAEADFGATFGLRSAYLRSRASSPANAGAVRLGNTENVSWRNAANNADLALSVNSSNVLTYAGNPVAVAALGSPNWVLQVDGAGTGVQYALIANSSIAPAAAIAVSKLASVTASRALVSDGSGFMSAAAVTATELGLLSGRTTALVDTVATQTLTNKTLTRPLVDDYFDINEESQPAAPSAGAVRIYAKSDRRLYRRDSAGLETSVGGGLDPVERSTALNPAVSGTLYLCDTSSAGFSITLPAGTSKAIIGFADSRETFATNNLTIVPASGERIGTQAANETLVLDVSGTWVTLTYDTVASPNRWVIQSAAPGSTNQAIVQGGNTLGAAMTIGTNDSQVLNLRTAGTTKVSVGTDGILTATNGASGGAVQSRFNASNAPAALSYFCSNGNPYLGFNTTQTASSDNQTFTVSNIASRIVGFSGGNALSIDVAASGTAGNTITWVNALTASTAGAVTLGPASFTGTHTVNGNMTVGVSNSSNGTFRAQSNAATASSTTPVFVSQYTVDTDCTGGYFFEARNTAGSTIGRIEAATNTTVTYQTSSDSRLKQNPTSFDGLSKVLRMLPKEYEWKSNPGERDKGFYAQELFEVYPEAVSVGSDELTESGDIKNPWAIDYGRITPVLVKAIQELHAELQELKGAR